MNERNGIRGWFTPEEGAKYLELVSSIKNGNIIEMGSFNGLSLSYIVDICKENNNHIYAVDRYVSPELLMNIHKWDAFDTITLIQCDSVKALKFLSSVRFDLGFIDTSHEYERTIEEINLLLPLIKPGGYISGHDYNNPFYLGVSEAVDKIFSEPPNLAATFWFYKKG